MAGLWPASRTLEIGTDGRPAVGRRAYFYESGTLDALTTYATASLGSTNAAYVETDAYGRWPAVYFDETDEFYRVRVTESTGGTPLYDDDAVPIIGPTGGGEGGETPIDANGLLSTGDIKYRYGTGVIAGWVRMNARTIGSASSGATERANADTQALFEYLWTTDANLTVSGGRGSSATADFEADKNIALPDGRGRLLAMLDDMGNTAASVISGLTTLGEVMGDEEETLTAAMIPEITGTTSEDGAHTHDIPTPVLSGLEGGNNNRYPPTSTTNATATSEDGAHTHTVTVGESSPDPVSILPPLMGITGYIKL